MAARPSSILQQILAAPASYLTVALIPVQRREELAGSLKLRRDRQRREEDRSRA